MTAPHRPDRAPARSRWRCAATRCSPAVSVAASPRPRSPAASSRRRRRGTPRPRRAGRLARRLAEHMHRTRRPARPRLGHRPERADPDRVTVVRIVDGKLAGSIAREPAAPRRRRRPTRRRLRTTGSRSHAGAAGRAHHVRLGAEHRPRREHQTSAASTRTLDYGPVGPASTRVDRAGPLAAVAAGPRPRTTATAPVTVTVTRRRRRRPRVVADRPEPELRQPPAKPGAEPRLHGRRCRPARARTPSA